MKLRQAQIHKSAAISVASNSQLNHSGVYILKSPKFGITKTLVYYYQSGLAKAYYINKHNNLVYETLGGHPKDVLIIGDKEVIKEMPEVIY